MRRRSRADELPNRRTYRRGYIVGWPVARSKSYRCPTQNSGLCISRVFSRFLENTVVFGRAPPTDMARSPFALRWEEKFEDEVGYKDYDNNEEGDEGEGRFARGTRSGDAMPKSSAGFVLNDQDPCIVVASNRIVTVFRLMTRTIVH